MYTHACLVVCWFVYLFVRLVGWLACWLVDWLVGWLAGLLAGWLVGWLVWFGWLVCLLGCFFLRLYAFISAYIRRAHVVSGESAVQDRLALPFLALARPVPGGVDTRPGLETLAVFRLMDGFVILQVTEYWASQETSRSKQILLLLKLLSKLQEGWQSKLSERLSV